MFDTPNGPLPLNFLERNFQDIILAYSRAVKNTQKRSGGYLKKSRFFHRTPYFQPCIAEIVLTIPWSLSTIIANTKDFVLVMMPTDDLSDMSVLSNDEGRLRVLADVSPAALYE